MNYMKSIAIVIILAGIGIIVTAVTSSTLQLQIAGALAGVGFICLGLLQLIRKQDRKQDKERFEQIMAKLEQLQQELQKEDKSKGSGVAIADVIASGLKYYSEYMTKPKKEEDKEQPPG